jgi:hypothetical protein
MAQLLTHYAACLSHNFQRYAVHLAYFLGPTLALAKAGCAMTMKTGLLMKKLDGGHIVRRLRRKESDLRVACCWSRTMFMLT